VFTIGELEKGIAKLPVSSRRTRLETCPAHTLR
jgi:hypothetical protein